MTTKTPPISWCEGVETGGHHYEAKYRDLPTLDLCVLVGGLRRGKEGGVTDGCNDTTDSDEIITKTGIRKAAEACALDIKKVSLLTCSGSLPRHLNPSRGSDEDIKFAHTNEPLLSSWLKRQYRALEK